jgi:pyrophosphate--fructose-6-phosphate 1-phosphotransferase
MPSPLQRERLAFRPTMPTALSSAGTTLTSGATLAPPSDSERIAEIFPQTSGKPIQHIAPSSTSNVTRPLRIGAVLSGGQAPGGRE